jgi:hypothetical protein
MNRIFQIIAGTLLPAVFFPFVPIAAANPALTPGVWKNISPPNSALGKADNVFCQGMAIDPNNPSTLYLCVCAYDVSLAVGLFKSTNGGESWARAGNLDEPVHVVVDPKNSNRLYCVDGVRGNTIGFWVSTDAGASWTKPDGFSKATQGSVGTQDLYSVAIEPGNFDHVLVSFHSPWSGGSNNAGILESTDGGTSWKAVNPPEASAGGYGMAVFFLYFPQLNLGDKNTWLFTAQQGGFFRTTDAGSTWSLVYDKQMTHGGNQIYCSKTGVLYSGGYQYPARSTNNGASWTQITKGLDYSWYMGVCGDGQFIYIGNSGENRPFFVSPESDGTQWSVYRGGAQTFSSDPFEMGYDPVNGIMYSSNWEGLFALKTTSGASVNDPPAKAGRALARPGTRKAVMGAGVFDGCEAFDGSGRRMTGGGKKPKAMMNIVKPR